jgi:hypothetical protein
VIEEAHEFLSADRISKMPVLFEQVSRIAKRGRKRWLGLVFATQLPQHLPARCSAWSTATCSTRSTTRPCCAGSAT